MKPEQILTATLADEWDHFEAILAPANASDEQMSLVMQAFYAGAIAATMPVALLEYGVQNEDAEFATAALSKLVDHALEGQRFCKAMAAVETLGAEAAREAGDRRVVAGADVEPGDYVKFDPADPTRRTVVPVPRKEAGDEG